MSFQNTLFAAVAVISLGTAAAANTVTNGGNISAGQNGAANGFTDPTSAGPNGIRFQYTALTDLRVQNFVSFSSIGFNNSADLATVTFGHRGAVGNSGSYTTFTNNGATTEANSSLPGFDLLAGESFTLYFNQAGGTDITSHQVNFATTVISTPLPAGLLLMGTALAGFGMARRRKAA